MREHIAHLAARLMAEDGIEDYALAKRKAARQAGAPGSRQMPNNDEIDAALRTYRQLYQKAHPVQVRGLRELALDVMAELAKFDPHLTGAVLTGTAGKYADVQIQLFAGAAKEVELFLLDRAVRYRTGAVRLFAGELPIEAEVLSFERDNVPVHLTLLSPRELRSRITASVGGRTIERANMQAVELLLAAA